MMQSYFLPGLNTLESHLIIKDLVVRYGGGDRCVPLNTVVHSGFHYTPTVHTDKCLAVYKMQVQRKIQTTHCLVCLNASSLAPCKELAEWQPLLKNLTHFAVFAFTVSFFCFLFFSLFRLISFECHATHVMCVSESESVVCWIQLSR